MKVFYTDLKEKRPGENILINKICADMVNNKKYDFIGRIYKHKKGIVLGYNENSEDIDLEKCNELGYEVVRRVSGGSLVVVDPELTLCYSLFFRNNEKLDINDVYKSIAIPLAKNLGKEFTIEGNYYIRYNNNGKSIPIAGHAMHTHKNAIQLDGVINLKELGSILDEGIIKTRELYEHNGKKYIKVDECFYDTRGKKVSLDTDSLKLLRSEKEELKSIIGLYNINKTEDDFADALKKASEEVFGKFENLKHFDLDKSLTDQYLKFNSSIYNIENNKGRKHLGHCFVDFIDEEQKLHYKSVDNEK